MTQAPPAQPPATAARKTGPRIPLIVEGLPSSVALQLEETQLPSPHSVDLVDSPRAGYVSRLLAREPNVAELFHANSSLSRYSAANQAADPTLVDAAREWFFATGYQPLDGDFDDDLALEHRVRVPLGLLPDGLGAALRPLVTANPRERSLYSGDMWLVAGTEVFRVPARRGVLWKERTLTERERADLFDAIVAEPAPAHRDVLLVWVVVPWRQMVFRGPRGYRHALLELGGQIAVVEAELAAAGVGVRTTYDFYDDAVNRLLEVDGTEHAAIAVSVLDPTGRAQ
ncbi:MAG TPA: hypothetical protein VNA20_18010 [Frankiaceae bacterium]|nr:hypothetical protein [Frankiaceae bacterium]